MLNFHFDEFPILETERLLLRQVAEEDVKTVMSFRNDPRSRQYTGRDPYKDEAEAMATITKSIEGFKKSEAAFWAITIKGNNEMIGGIGFWRIMKEHYRAEMGISILPELWSMGYASEAMEPVVKFGFEQMKLHTIEANVNPDNAGSVKVLEKSGFIREGYLKENFFHNGKFFDTFIYSKHNPNQL